ncbi:hypothetical protein Hanom_Chr12g01165741 [Helianthus anomalus]
MPEMDSFGRNFYLNFLIAFFTIIGHAIDNTVINQQFLHNMKQDVQINQLNWCGYLIQCLQHAKTAWSPKKSISHGP